MNKIDDIKQTHAQKSSKILEETLQEIRGMLGAQKYNTWVGPLQFDVLQEGVNIFAPNRFVIDCITQQGVFELIKKSFVKNSNNHSFSVQLIIGSKNEQTHESFDSKNTSDSSSQFNSKGPSSVGKDPKQTFNGNLNRKFTFDCFVEGKSNQLARAAAFQIAQNPGGAYNPFFIYGGVGLGKTHLVHAVGNYISKMNQGCRILYLHSERFVSDMVKALQTNKMNSFKEFYRSIDVLLIDDIQFFAGKDRTQEEFFHTFNFLLESQHQVILTCDRYPKELSGLEERLKSRFGWGLTVSIEPPDLETRVAILMNKAEQAHTDLPKEVAFFIAKRIRSNVRELEGALKRVTANAHFTGKSINIEFAREALKDLIALQEKLVTIENIQKTVAEYYKIRLAELLSKKRNRSISRPRQMAMTLAKELTNHSLPEIGDAFGGRDHTTVLHAIRVIQELKISSNDFEQDYLNLQRILTS